MPIHNSVLYEQPTNPGATAAANPGGTSTVPTAAPSLPQPSARGLQLTGPTLSVEISLHPSLMTILQQQGQVPPQPIAGVGLIDTGATVTAVDVRVLNQLQIAPVGTIQVGTAGGRQTQQLFPATVRFPEIGFQGQFTSVLGADLTGQGFIALIGRDVLSRALLVYNGGMGQFIISF